MSDPEGIFHMVSSPLFIHVFPQAFPPTCPVQTLLQLVSGRERAGPEVPHWLENHTFPDSRSSAVSGRL